MKRITQGVLLIAALFLGGCKDNDIEPVENTGSHEVSLTFNVTVDSGILTRSGEDGKIEGPRKLISSDCYQNVTDLRVYVFRSEDNSGDDSFKLYDVENKGDVMMGMNAYIRILGFDGQPDFSDSEFNGNFDNDETHSYTINPKLPDGYYRFLAVGIDSDKFTPLNSGAIIPEAEDQLYRSIPEADNSSTDYSDSDIERDSKGIVATRYNWDEPNYDVHSPWVIGECTWTQTCLQNEYSGTEASSTEIFSGYAANPDGTPLTVEVNSEKQGFLVDIVLRRAVAGTLLYVKNIPETFISEYTWKYSGITAGDSAQVDEVAIVASGQGTILHLLYRTPWYGYRRFGIDKLYAVYPMTRLVSLKAEEFSDFYNMENQEGKLKGEFQYPVYLSEHGFDSEWGENIEGKSLALALFSNGVPIAVRPIKIARSEEMHKDEYSLDAAPKDAEGYVFDLVANNLYCLGNRNFEDGTDNPIDLSEALKHPELEITVIGAWQSKVDIEIK